MSSKDVLPENGLPEKAATTKWFEYSLLGKELEKQTRVAEKQCQSFDKVSNHDEEEETVKTKTEKPVKIKKEGSLTTDESSLFYSKKYSFSEWKNVEKYMDDSLVTRYNNYLAAFKQWLNKFAKFTPRTVKTKMKRKIVSNSARKLYYMLLNIYFNDCNNITDERKKRWGKYLILMNYLLKVKNLLHWRKKKKVNHS